MSLRGPALEAPQQVVHVRHAEPLKVCGGDGAPRPALALHHDRPVARDLGQALREVAEGDVACVRQVARRPLALIPDVDQGDRARCELDRKSVV